MYKKVKAYLKKRKDRKTGIRELALAFAGECMLFHAEKADVYYDRGVRAEDIVDEVITKGIQ